MTWAPRDVVVLVIAVALAVAFDAVVIGAVITGELAASTASSVSTAFVFLAALVGGYLGLHRFTHNGRDHP